ncbi:MAG TPA: S9 family peptidase [Acidimicrobiales bacterium]|nr:S9 family peptidase [Acidimicrobiales bacterium]
MIPPSAPRRPTTLTTHGDDRVDDWYWLRDKDDPETIAYLEAENAYTAAGLAHTEALQELLFSEIKGRVLETDLSVPYRHGPWWYYARTIEGQQYPIHCRAADAGGSGEQVLFDMNLEAGGAEFFAMGNRVVSPDHNTLAYSTDTDGNERFTLRFRDLTTGEDHPDLIPGTSEGGAWADDNRTFFYTTVDGQERPYRVWRHRLGTPGGDDDLVFEEPDPRYFVEVDRTRSGAFLFIAIGSKITTEFRIWPTSQPDAAPVVAHPREQGVEYYLEHHRSPHGDRFFVATNADGAANFKLMEATLPNLGREHWIEVEPERPDVKLDGVDAFADHLVLYERAEGVRRLRIRDVAGGETHVIDQPEAVSTAWAGTNMEFATATLRYQYESLVTPPSVFDYDMASRTRELKKQQPVLGGYEPSDYATDREWATAPDGTKVPITLVWRKDAVTRDGTGPALLYGYGSYEISRDPSFSSARLSLLDRGVVYAVAQVRGGGELGRRWYEEGKYLKKTNTFTDFIACAEHLVSEGWTSPARLAIRGGSAGGLLVGAVLNMRPDLFGAAVAQVPFVDVLTTILDESLPLTVTEWEEWGNPNERQFYDYMKSYSPYDNVRPVDYPAMLVTAGLNDPRVSYWEPAKWVAKLRVTKTGDRALFLKTEMGAGHKGPSGRYDAWRDEALVFAFVLDALGATGA